MSGAAKKEIHWSAGQCRSLTFSRPTLEG